MKRVCIMSFFAILGLLAGGCGKTSVAVPQTAQQSLIPTHAQDKLPTIKLWIGAELMDAEMALTEEEERTGMMFRTNMAENQGMIFVFPEPTRASFWMKNTLLPLSAAYISPAGTILEIHDMQPQDTNEVLAATDNVQFVLEARQGWFKRHNIKEGMGITTENGPLHKVFLQN